jgi:flagellar hook-associated protein 2
MDVTVDGSGNLTSASVNGDSSMFTVSGNLIIGNYGTPYAGMSFGYTGTTSQSITVSSTSGLASQLYQVANNFSQSSGSLQTLITNLQSNDTDLQTKITDIDTQASNLQTQLQNQYAQYQAQILTADNTLSYLTALLNANNNSQN